MTVLTKSPGLRKLAAGHWRRWRGYVLVACPSCGRVAGLEHEVSDEGVISPSLVCPCGFHETGVRLNGWDAPTTGME